MKAILEHLDRMEGRIREDLRRLESKVDTTNGRVSELEKWRSTVHGARYVAAAIVSALVATAISLLPTLFG